jgi:hypothetical protein
MGSAEAKPCAGLDVQFGKQEGRLDYASFIPDTYHDFGWHRYICGY